jgi:3-isopropylmalate dehydratase small subunit
VPSPIENVDTDQIIPLVSSYQTVKAVLRQPFRDWKYNGDDNSKAHFRLNDATYSGNFVEEKLCSGSSREHAVSGVMITDSCSGFFIFADIFKGNCLNIVFYLFK